MVFGIEFRHIIYETRRAHTYTHARVLHNIPRTIAMVISPICTYILSSWFASIRILTNARGPRGPKTLSEDRSRPAHIIYYYAHTYFDIIMLFIIVAATATHCTHQTNPITHNIIQQYYNMTFSPPRCTAGRARFRHDSRATRRLLADAIYSSIYI